MPTPVTPGSSDPIVVLNNVAFGAGQNSLFTIDASSYDTLFVIVLLKATAVVGDLVTNLKVLGPPPANFNYDGVNITPEMSAASVSGSNAYNGKRWNVRGLQRVSLQIVNQNAAALNVDAIYWAR